MDIKNATGFDTETTGVNPNEDRIVTATTIRQTDPTPITEWLINPGVEIPQEAIDVHGVTNEQAKAEGADPAVSVLQIANKLQEAEWIVIYNARFDIPILQAELQRHGHPTLPKDTLKRVIDPLVLDRCFDKYRKGKRTLEITSQFYGVDTDVENLHDATTDVLTTLALAEKLLNKYPQVKTLDLDGLYDLHARAHRNWAVGFNRWKGSNVIDVNWL